MFDHIVCGETFLAASFVAMPKIVRNVVGFEVMSLSFIPALLQVLFYSEQYLHHVL